MKAKVKRVLDDALKLTEKERAELAVKLLETVDSEDEDNVEAAWVAEIQKRVKELEHGQVKAIPWSVAWQEIVERGHGKSRA